MPDINFNHNTAGQSGGGSPAGMGGPGGPGPGGMGGPGGPDGGPRGPHAFINAGSAIKLTEDGKVSFRLASHGSTNVSVAIGNHMRQAKTITLTDDGKGLFEAVIDPAAEGICGPQCVNFIVDGEKTFHPSAPVWFYANSLCNYFDFPDPETDSLIDPRTDIPHGSVSHEYFYSEVYGKTVSSLVYTPPGYEKGREYPVFYLFHEIAENETMWSNPGKINFLMDHLVADGKCRPFIIVENDCTMDVRYKDQEYWYSSCDDLEKMLFGECAAVIEGKYRTAPGKYNRAIGGFGLGAIQAAFIGLHNLDKIGNIGVFTAFWPSSDFYKEGKDDPFFSRFTYVSEHPEELRVFFRAEGDLDMHFKGIGSENEALDASGITSHPGYVFNVYHQDHNWGMYRRALRDLAPLLFNDPVADNVE